MRVLLVHNSYRQRGGEDVVFEAERDLLAARGHEVLEFRRHNDAVDGGGRLALLAGTVWSRRSRRDLSRSIRAFRPDVAHFHNTLPLISPSGYAAANDAGVPVVQTLHNYRMVCPSALLFRDGAVCEACVGRRIAWPAVRHACYRGSRGASAAVAALLAVHGAIGTWRRRVGAFIALTEFQRGRVVRGGVPEDRVVVLPNFLPVDPGVTRGEARRGVLFAGRFTEEKGIRVLLDAFARLPADATLRLAGDGPLRPLVVERAARDPRIALLGALDAAGVDRAMRSARVLAVPSLWYEGLPMTVVEAFARGLPVVASDLGGLRELVRDGATGRSFPPGDPDGLAGALQDVLNDNARARALAHAARAEFELRFTADAHHRGLLEVYAFAAGARCGARPASGGGGAGDHSPAEPATMAR